MTQNKDQNLFYLIETEGEENLVAALETAIDNGADTATVNSNGDTALHTLINCISETKLLRKAAKILINAEYTDINALDAAGKTPLHLAIEAGYGTTARLLINYQANLLIKDNNGKLPLDAAKEENNDPQLTAILEAETQSQQILARLETIQSSRNLGKRPREEQSWQERVETPPNKQNRANDFSPTP